MDRALLREREAFKNRAMAVPVVENKKLKKNDGSAAERKAKKIAETGGGLSKAAKSKFDMQQYRASAASGASSTSMFSGASSTQFSVLAKIVRHMKTRHMEGEITHSPWKRSWTRPISWTSAHAPRAGSSTRP
ncbi:Transcription initiation factor IIE subunit beta [Caligus rogercresseyi]|uniref:Transcription initiation factor IIE subunit beta n=1 Tax=Caligus rogercresseyi TaxID=217165 RepID=A0A7T8KAQ6_CALRO|nr:Transcription initiation factor IIE subunit beta [Caligus rogercresseyi]